MKRRCFFILISVLLVILTGCGPLVDEEDIKKEYRVYASFYPVFALSSMIIDEDIPDMHLYCLIQPQDGCLRNYSLSDWDLYLASGADVMIMNGNGLEKFESGFLNLGEDAPAVISLTGGIALRHSEISEDEESHFHGANPWLFLSVDGAKEMLKALYADMIYLDPGYAEAYLANLSEAENRLDRLKDQMRNLMGGGYESIPLAVAHEGLMYFVDEWNMNTICVLQRESGVMPEEDELESMLKELSRSGARCVLIEKQAPEALLKAYENAGVKCVLMDTMSSGSAEKGAQGYFDAMMANAASIGEFLKEENRGK